MFRRFVALVLALCGAREGSAQVTIRTATELEVIATDERWAAANRDCNLDVMRSLLSDDLTYVHTSAVVDSKTGFLEKLSGCPIESVEIEPTSARVRDSTAVVNGTLRLKFKGREIGLWVVYTRVYIRRASGWQLSAHHGTERPVARVAMASDATGCADDATGPGTYARCALWVDGRTVRRGAESLSVGRVGLFRPLQMTRLVSGDSAMAYAMKFEKRSSQSSVLALLGLGLTTAGLVLAPSVRCNPNALDGCSGGDDNTLITATALVLAGAGFTVASIPFQLGAVRAGAKAVWWNNARFAR